MNASFVLWSFVAVITITVILGTTLKMAMHGVRGQFLLLSPIILITTAIGIPVLAFQLALFSPNKLDSTTESGKKVMISQMSVTARSLIAIDMILKLMQIFPTILGVTSEYFSRFMRERKRSISAVRFETDAYFLEVYALAAQA